MNVLWLEPGLNNSVTATCGETNASLTVKTFRVDIVLERSGETTTITGQTADVIVGQKLTLRANVVPLFGTGITAEYAWNVPPKTLKDYVITFEQVPPLPGEEPTANTSAVTIPLAPADLVNQNVTLHCIDRLDGPVTLSVSILQRSRTVQASLNVLIPASNFTAIMTAQDPAVTIFTTNTTPYLGLGQTTPPSLQGVRFFATVTPPVGGDGEIAIIQLINTSRTYRKYAINGAAEYRNCRQSSEGHFVLDRSPSGSEPWVAQYGSQLIPAFGNHVADLNEFDAPSLPLQNYFDDVKVSETFKTYLVYRPTGGIWVTLKLLEWWWVGEADNSTPNQPGGWTLIRADSDPPQNVIDSIATAELPLWTGRIQDLLNCGPFLPSGQEPA